MTAMTWVSRIQPLARDGETSRLHRLERHRHVIAVSAGAAAVAATLAGWTPSSNTAMAVVIMAIGIGMPHGALDIVLGPRMARPAAFFGAYLAVAATSVLIWLLAPVLGLVTFFAASWFHFARGDSTHHRHLGSAGPLLGMSTAGCAIGLPLAFHPGIVTPVLSDLLMGTTAPTVEQVATLGWMIACPSIVVGIVAGLAALQIRRYASAVELLTIAVLSGVVHPLISFALYFALWHSPRHLITLDIDTRTWARTAAATVATLIIGTITWRVTDPSPATAARVVFIGLAALTGPHLVVTERLRSAISFSGAPRALRRR